MALCRRQKYSDGISLYTMLAAMVVLGLLTGTTVTYLSGNNSKATALASVLIKAGDAANRFHLDTGCWPENVEALTNRDTTGSNNTCRQPISTNRWHGPYLQLATREGGTGINLDRFSPGGTSFFSTYAGRPRLNTIQLDKDIAQKAAGLIPGRSFASNQSNGWWVTFFYPG